MNSLTNFGDAMRQELVVVKTFLHLVPTHIDDPAFRKRFLELANQAVGTLDDIATDLITTRIPRATSQSKGDVFTPAQEERVTQIIKDAFLHVINTKLGFPQDGTPPDKWPEETKARYFLLLDLRDEAIRSLKAAKR